MRTHWSCRAKPPAHSEARAIRLPPARRSPGVVVGQNVDSFGSAFGPIGILVFRRNHWTPDAHGGVRARRPNGRAPTGSTHLQDIALIPSEV